MSIEDFVGGYVRYVVEVVVHRKFFVNEVFFYGIEVGTLALVLQDLHCILDGAEWV